MADTTGITNGTWTTNKYESEGGATQSDWGMIYRSGAHLNERVNTLATELQKMLSDPKIEMDNPVILAKLSALTSHYNLARQTQSNISKQLKETAQTISRNM
ncbi:type III secretion apparatus needle protein [Yersinia enterocolitica]|nr:type III secretion apparatus needle protein [Yersinia enterocolitica]